MRLVTLTLLVMMSVLKVWGQDSLTRAEKRQQRIERIHAVHNKVDSALLKRYWKTKYDTSYISRTPKKLTLRLRPNLSGSFIYIFGNFNGTKVHTTLRSDVRSTLSIGFSYIGITAAFSLNPGKWSGRNKDYEINLNYYGRQFCAIASYQNTKTLSGIAEYAGQTVHVDKGHINMKMLNMSAYYVFNHRRFSYPAAMTQSYIQKRSAGSWLAGLSLQYTHIRTEDNMPATLPHLRMRTGHIGVGGGYAYNIVIRKRWMLHFSLLPTLVVVNIGDTHISGLEKDLKTGFPSGIITGHMAFIGNITPRYFVGCTAMGTGTFFNVSDVHINQSKWLARVFFGTRLF